MNEKINIDYDKLGTTADDIEQGNAYIDRLSLEEERGRTKGGRTNVEASIILAGNRCTDRRCTQGATQQEIIKAQEQLLKQYATDKNLWIREQDVAAASVRQLESGYESRVYLGRDNKVTKFVNLNTLRYTPADFIDNRISLYNHLFIQTTYELVGFSDNDGRFEFVLRQTFIQGRHLDFNIEDDVQLLDAEMQQRGFRKLMPGEYENDCYGLYDLRNGNVIIDEDGNLFFIDVVTKLNTSTLLGGTRHYGSGKIVNIPKQETLIASDQQESNDKPILKTLNQQFNDELLRQIEGTLPKMYTYRLGVPSAVLRSAGVPNLPIELRASRLNDKSRQEEHPFDLSEVTNLPKSIQSPLAVFRSATHVGAYVVMTELEHAGENYVVVLDTIRKQSRIVVNDIRSLYPKTSRQIAQWIDDELLAYTDKKRTSEWISKQRSNSAEVRNLFRRAAKVVQDFQYPTLPA